MYGLYNIPVALTEQSVDISIKRSEGSFLYARGVGKEGIEKTILGKDCHILINPVEPLYTPKSLTPYFLIEFARKLIIEPRGSSRVYLTFPAEIGVYAGRSAKNTKDFRLIDIFSLYPGKYALYGDIRTGILCKYHSSEIYMSPPATSPLIEGEIELAISNKTDLWAEVSKVVFNAYLMKIYYSGKRMGMKASMTLIDKDIAETSFSDSPLEKGMKKAVEHYVSRGIIMTSSTFTMEWGYDSQ